MEMQMDWSYVGAVVISGLAIVFVALILLILAVWLMGKIFAAVSSGKSDKGNKKTESGSVPQQKNEPAPMLNTADEDDSEVIAVIAAAVAAMSEELGQPLKIRSIRRAGGSSRSSAWARAAQSESTRAF